MREASASSTLSQERTEEVLSLMRTERDKGMAQGRKKQKEPFQSCLFCEKHQGKRPDALGNWEWERMRAD